MDELRAINADVERLRALARTSKADLTTELKALGFAKMGLRKRIEVELLASKSGSQDAPSPGAGVAAPDAANFWASLADESAASTSFDLSFGSGTQQLAEKKDAAIAA